LSSYSIDASGFSGSEERVVVPADERELVAVLREADAGGTPVTISGAGTGLTGGRVAQSGWVVSTERFKRLEVHSGYAVCGAGVLLRDLQAAAAGSGQLYAPDPTESLASIGGNIATNASGSRSFRYGDTRRHVRALRVVRADGEVLVLRRGEKPPFVLPVLPGPSTTKNTAGYFLRAGMDFLDLFVGSEGTLGVVTEAELALLPAPTALLAGVVLFT
jgi:FAD/FMN-containing dehydrogenase